MAANKKMDILFERSQSVASKIKQSAVRTILQMEGYSSDAIQAEITPDETTQQFAKRIFWSYAMRNSAGITQRKTINFVTKLWRRI